MARQEGMKGSETWQAGAFVPRHRHAQAYAALVLCGAYEECGSKGRLRVAAGDVLLHDAFDAHLDRFTRQGARILNFILPDRSRYPWSLGRVADPDGIARTAERDSEAAQAQLCEELREYRSGPADWPDRLAADLAQNPNRRLDEWARDNGLAEETVSRGFRKVFAVTPASFRGEARAHRAYLHIVRTALPLATIAARAGFADQAHMTRAVKALTGHAPLALRMSNSFKTERAVAA